MAALDSTRIRPHRCEGWPWYQALARPPPEDARQVEGGSVLRWVPLAELWHLVVSSAAEVAAQDDGSRVVGSTL